jgi:zinc protease
MPRVPHALIRLRAVACVLGGFALFFFALALIEANPTQAEIFGAETFTLKNGMQVVVVPNHRAPVVIHMVWYRVGAADEPPSESGVAHFLEHLMFKGTDEVPTGEFSKIVARHGGVDNAFTSHDYTAYHQKVARDHLELVMKLEADRMTNLRITEAEVIPERDVVLEERRSRTDNDPARQFSEQFNAAQYLSHPYGGPVIGWAHEIRALTTEAALAFYRAHYAPNNAILVVVGDVTADELKPLAETYYGAIPARELEPRTRPQEPPQLAARRVELAHERVRQPELSRSYLAPSQSAGDSEHAYPLLVLANILGGETGRIYHSLVVEQEIAAYAAAYYDDFSLDLTQFMFYASPLPGVEIARLETAVDAEIEKLLAEGVTTDEVARAQDRMIAEAVYAADSLGGTARILGMALTTGVSVEEVEAWPERIRVVTVDAVNAAARAVLRPETSVTGILIPDDATN